MKTPLLLLAVLATAIAPARAFSDVIDSCPQGGDVLSKPAFTPPLIPPQPTEGDQPASSEFDFAIEYDLRTKTARRIALPPKEQWLSRANTPSSEGSAPRGIGTTHEPINALGLDGFSPTSPIYGVGNFPWRLNGRLQIILENGLSAFGSAALVDPYHIITAGHALLNQHWNGLPAGLQFIPGYENGARPFGAANVVSYFILPGWLYHRDQEQDIAILRLDRPIGALTGHFGMGVNSNCSFFENGNFYNISYPAVAPYVAGQPYYRAGTFDSCPSATEMRHGHPAAPGTSGSAYYTFVGGHRIAYGVVSHGFANHPFWTYTDACRFSPATFSAAVSYMHSTRTVTPDLVPVDVQESAPYVARGSWLNDSNVLIYNHSENGFAGTVSGAIYLSRNRTITTSDTYVGYLSQPTSIPGMGSSRVDFDMFINPASLPLGGRYYVGVILSTYDGNSANNTTTIHDVGQVIVY